MRQGINLYSRIELGVAILYPHDFKRATFRRGEEYSKMNEDQAALALSLLLRSAIATHGSRLHITKIIRPLSPSRIYMPVPAIDPRRYSSAGATVVQRRNQIVRCIRPCRLYTNLVALDVYTPSYRRIGT